MTGMLQAKSSNVQVVVICDCYNYSQQISQAVGQACAEAIAGTYGSSTCNQLVPSASTSTSTSGTGAEAVAAAGK